MVPWLDRRAHGGLYRWLAYCAIFICITRYTALASYEPLIRTWYLEAIEINTCGALGNVRTYWLFRGNGEWIEAWRIDDPKQFTPKRMQDGRWLMIWDDSQTSQIIYVVANSIYHSRTPYDVELSERQEEFRRRHIRHEFRQAHTKDRDAVVAP